MQWATFGVNGVPPRMGPKDDDDDNIKVKYDDDDEYSVIAFNKMNWCMRR